MISIRVTRRALQYPQWLRKVSPRRKQVRGALYCTVQIGCMGCLTRIVAIVAGPLLLPIGAPRNPHPHRAGMPNLWSILWFP